ncbi:MAG: MBL fold metallo-hydrolase [Dehalococcoidales bacterium]|nr:MBL fold metallo-hydrolase [Dehalococcoidales bacterium]
MKLVDNLYAYVWQGEDNNCNSYLFANVLEGGKHVLIDPGHVVTPAYRQPGWRRLVQEMENDGLDASAVGLVILTHSHGDHCEAAGIIRKEYGALVAASEAESRLYSRLGGVVDVFLEEGELLLGPDGQLKLDVFLSPGHSPGHITLYWPEREVLIVGDVIFFLSTGRVDLPGGSAAALKQSIDRLSKLDVEYLLCGHPHGHPGVIEGKETIEKNFAFIKANILF